MKKLSFFDFVSTQFLSKQEKEEFQLWLKREAYTSKFEFEWIRLLDEWLRSKLDKVSA